MSASTRRALFVLSAVFVALLVFVGFSGIPASGLGRAPAGDMVNAFSRDERHLTDAVTAVNFDYRGLDTMGEEFILFTSVAAVAVLLRRMRDEDESHEKSERKDERLGRRSPATSDAVRLLSLLLVGVTVTFGLYVVAHGQLTPGGGFQGGVVLATASLIVYLAGGPGPFQRVVPKPLASSGEAVGVMAFVGTGFLGIAVGKAFLTNVLPLGRTGQVFSSGTVWALNLFTGIEVAAGFSLLLVVFVEEVGMRRRGGRR